MKTTPGILCWLSEGELNNFLDVVVLGAIRYAYNGMAVRLYAICTLVTLKTPIFFLLVSWLKNL